MVLQVVFCQTQRQNMFGGIIDILVLVGTGRGWFRGNANTIGKQRLHYSECSGPETFLKLITEEEAGMGKRKLFSEIAI